MTAAAAGLIGQLVVGPVEAGMTRCGHPVLHPFDELVGGHAQVTERHDVQQPVVPVTGQQGGDVTAHGGLHHRVGGDVRLGGRPAFDFAKSRRHRLAVVTFILGVAAFIGYYFFAAQHILHEPVVAAGLHAMPSDSSTGSSCGPCSTSSDFSPTA